MSTEIDDNEVIMPGDGSVGGGFSLMPEGNIDDGTGIEVEFNGKIEPYGEDKEGIRFEAFYVDDPDARSSIFCKLTEQAGLIKMLDIIRLSGVAEKLKKQGKMKSDPTKGLKAAILRDKNFQEQLKISINGCRILATVAHKKGMYKGSEVTNANINKMAAIGAKGVAKPAAEKAQAETSAVAGDSEAGGW